MPYELLDAAPPTTGRYELLDPLPAAPTSMTDKLINFASGANDFNKNAGKGFASGVADLGDALLNGASRLADKVGLGVSDPSKSTLGRLGITPPLQGRSESLKAFNDENQDSLAFRGARLAGNVAATWPVGGALGAGMKAVAPFLGRAAPLVEGLANSTATGGMSTGMQGANAVTNMATRVAGGAINGAATTAASNSDDIGTGALIGGAFPVAAKVAGEAGKLTGLAVSGLAKNTLGMTTGAGAETFGTAYRAGKEGGTSFLDNMRGNVPMTDVLDSAKDALSKMRIDRSNQYKSGMVDISKDKSVIDFAPIDDAVNSLRTMGSYKGQVINKNAAGTVDEITGIVNQWKDLNPAEYHTPEGLDALKKSIGDVRDATQFGTPGRKAADTAYNSVKAQIDLQAPTYAKVMQDYSQASNTLTEIEKSLSLGNKAAADTSMRKLQSLMRNNVNTNYGNRLGLAKTLEDQGADILPAIAGQAASSFTPRGLQGLAASGAGVAGLMNPLALAALPFASPRLMGEMSYGLGAMTRGIGNASSRVGGATSSLLGRTSRSLPGDPDTLGLLGSTAYRTAPLMYRSNGLLSNEASGQ